MNVSNVVGFDQEFNFFFPFFDIFGRNFDCRDTFNPFVLDAPFLYPLKPYGFLMITGAEKGYIGNKWVSLQTSNLQFTKANKVI